jgi:hypothetical protein
MVAVSKKVDIGELEELIKNQPDLAPTLALGKRLILNTSTNLGDYASMIVFGTEEMTPEIVISKKELRRFAEEILEKVKL